MRTASCRCGQLKAECVGDPVRISVCHCLNCKRRSGSAFAAQARWPDDRVRLTGEYEEFEQPGDGGSRATFRFCPNCGSDIAYVAEGLPGLTAIPIGAFADPAFPGPEYSVYEERRHAWVAILGDDVEHMS